MFSYESEKQKSYIHHPHWLPGPYIRAHMVLRHPSLEYESSPLPWDTISLGLCPVRDQP